MEVSVWACRIRQPPDNMVNDGNGLLENIRQNPDTLCSPGKYRNALVTGWENRLSAMFPGISRFPTEMAALLLKADFPHPENKTVFRQPVFSFSLSPCYENDTPLVRPAEISPDFRETPRHLLISPRFVPSITASIFRIMKLTAVPWETIAVKNAGQPFERQPFPDGPCLPCRFRNPFPYWTQNSRFRAKPVLSAH